MLPLINRGETRGRAGIRRLVEVADAFMQVGRRYAGDGDRMSEQFHRYVKFLDVAQPPASNNDTDG
jgi:hypothetical protein